MQARSTSMITFWFSKPFLTSPFMLWSLFIINCLGTIYGYVWYFEQLVYTVERMSPWLVLFVPDSPTASLFFTISIVYLLFDRYIGLPGQSGKPNAIRGIIEALAVITSVKYGIWAVVMIAAGAYQGDPIVWQEWMLIVSHLGMAAEALLFARFFQYRIIHLAFAAAWTLSNDYIDYYLHVYPWLPSVLNDNIGTIEIFTMIMSISSIAAAFAFIRYRKFYMV